MAVNPTAYICTNAVAAIDSGYLSAERGDIFLELHREEPWAWGRLRQTWGWLPRSGLQPLDLSNAQERSCSTAYSSSGGGYVSLLAGQTFLVLAREGPWSWGISPDDIGWAPTRILERALLWFDGSTDDRRGVAGCAVLTMPSGERLVTKAHCPGFFLGSATSELLGFLRGLDLAKNLHPGSMLSVRSDSQRVVGYLSGVKPSSAAGRKLLPLIALAREQLALCGHDVQLRWESRRSNPAGPLATAAMRAARDEGWLRPTGLPDGAMPALRQVEANNS